MTRRTAASRTVQAKPGIGTAVSGSDSTRPAVRGDTTDSAVRTSFSIVVSAMIPSLLGPATIIRAALAPSLRRPCRPLEVTVSRHQRYARAKKVRRGRGPGESHRIEFRLLGTVEVIAEYRVIEIGGRRSAQQCAALAAQWSRATASRSTFAKPSSRAVA